MGGVEVRLCKAAQAYRRRQSGVAKYFSILASILVRCSR